MKLVERLQIFLNENDFNCGVVDGIAGKNTFRALDDMIATIKNGGEKEGGAPGLVNNDIIKQIRTECNKAGFNTNQTAYVLATVEHETAGTFKPVVEAYWLSEDWREKNLRYYPYHGRGYVQITWKENYDKYSKILSSHFKEKIDLASNPDLALKPEYAMIILIDGFKFGRFTGKKIADYINSSKVDFKNARKCINGLDKATHITKLARKYI